MGKRNPEKYIYVNTIKDVLGKSSDYEILRAGTYYMRMDYEEILAYAINHNMTVV